MAKFIQFTVGVVAKHLIRHGNVGDWRYTKRLVSALSADTGNADSNLLVLVHELVEARLCQKAGISERAVSAWDETHQLAEEPGEVVGCPYLYQHASAKAVEHCLAGILGVDWALHERRLANL